MPGSYCFEDDSFMRHFNPGLCLESLVPQSPKEGRIEVLRNGQGGSDLYQVRDPQEKPRGPGMREVKVMGAAALWRTKAPL